MTAPEALVEIVPHDSSWSGLFQEEAAILRRALAPWLAGPLEHIGSTAIPGLASKPVIDVIAAVVSLEDSRSPIETLQVGDLSVRAFEGAAVVTGRTTITTGGGKAETVTLRFTDVFIRGLHRDSADYERHQLSAAHP